MSNVIFNIIIRKLNLLITNRCNLWCSICDYKEFHRSHQDLTLKQIKILIKDAYDLGLEDLVLSGGEPMVREDIYSIIKYANIFNLNITLITNGTLIKKQEVDKLIRSGMKNVVISLEGFEEMNDSIRGKGNYQKALNAIKYFLNFKKEFGNINVGITLTRQNYKKIYDFSRFLIEDIGVAGISINPFHKEMLLREKTDQIKKFMIGEDILTDLKIEIEKIIEYSKKIGIIFHDDNFLRKIPDYFAGKNMIPTRRCTQPLRECAIEANGNVYPCWGELIRSGNINNKSLKEIIITEEYQKACLNALSNKCKGCLSTCYEKLH